MDMFKKFIKYLDFIEQHRMKSIIFNKRGLF